MNSFFRNKVTFFSIFIVSIFAVIFLMPSCGKNPQRILAIGDSNGAVENGWVSQLQKLRPNDTIMNYCISGNTIGFDNLGRDTLNTLNNIDAYIQGAEMKFSEIDMIIVMLGTNDTKAIFHSLQLEVIDNFDSLVYKITHYPYAQGVPQIYIASPPPIGNDSIMIEKYHGASARLQRLIPEFERISQTHQCHYIDVYNPLHEGFYDVTIDGIHFNDDGYQRIANIIHNAIDD